MYRDPDGHHLTLDVLLVAPLRLQRDAMVEILAEYHGAVVCHRPWSLLIDVMWARPFSTRGPLGLHDPLGLPDGGYTHVIKSQIICWNGSSDEIDRHLNGRHIDAIVGLRGSDDDAPPDHESWMRRSHPDAREYWANDLSPKQMVYRSGSAPVCPPLLTAFSRDALNDRAAGFIPANHGVFSWKPTMVAHATDYRSMEDGINAVAALVVDGMRTVDVDIDQLRQDRDAANLRSAKLESELVALRDHIAAITSLIPGLPALPTVRAPETASPPAPPTTARKPTVSDHHWVCGHCETELPIAEEICNVCGQPR